VSKLFNTLEQIRRQETYQVPPTKDTSGGNKKDVWIGKRSLGILMITACSAIVLYLSMPLVMQYMQTGVSIIPGRAAPGEKIDTQTTTAAHKPEATNPSRAGGNQDPAKNRTPSGSAKERQFITLIDQGAEHVQKLDYWKGIYFFDQARQLFPQRVEPLINTGVALSELGLNDIALRYFKQAAELNPNHPMLKANLEVLANAGIETREK
jgi:tetratricopeptide (TPR) repeat protein